MLTSTAPARVAYRPFQVTVARITSLSPHFVRVTFTGDDLGTFGAEGNDQRIKIVLPLAETGFDAFRAALGDLAQASDWYAIWRDLPDAGRNPLRTYTVRAVRSEAAEIDVDFVLHGDIGLASAWVSTAQPGDEVMVVGPDAAAGAQSAGIAWQPGEASTYLLVGDETAVPAICSILESLPDHAHGQAFIEVPSPDDVLDVVTPAGVTVSWLPRGETPSGSLFQPAVHDWLAATTTEPDFPAVTVDLADVDIDAEILWDVPVERPEKTLYSWIAGEAAAVKALRRHLVGERGLDRSQVAFMGYWREGKSESN